jgi:hypothetical protein
MLNDSLTHPFVLKRPSLSVGRNFVDAVLNARESSEGDIGGTGNDVTP